jgi:hypothetical protein
MNRTFLLRTSDIGLAGNTANNRTAAVVNPPDSLLALVKNSSLHAVIRSTGLIVLLTHLLLNSDASFGSAGRSKALIASIEDCGLPSGAVCFSGDNVAM